MGSATDTDGYAFAMNTFEWAGALTPLARYDARYARALGKWMLNLANASRFFYANALPAVQQDHRQWADRYDPAYCLAYEGLRKYPCKKESPRPYATGDAYRPGDKELNFCLYGSSHVGILGGIISRTSDERILQIDLLRTDYYHPAAFPTFLFYNPYNSTATFEADFGSETVDLYDPNTSRIAAESVRGRAKLTIEPDQAIIIVAAPAGVKLTRQGNRVFLGDTVAAWR